MKAEDTQGPEAEGMQSSVMYQALKGELKLIPLAKELLKHSQHAPTPKNRMIDLNQFFEIPLPKSHRKRKVRTTKSDFISTETAFVKNIFEELGITKPPMSSPELIEKNFVNAVESRTTLEFEKKDVQQKSYSAGNQRVPYTSTKLEKELSHESFDGADFGKKLNQKGGLKKKVDKHRQPKKVLGMLHHVPKEESTHQNKNKSKSIVKQRRQQKRMENMKLGLRQQQQDYHESAIDNAKKNVQKIDLPGQKPTQPILVIERSKHSTKDRQKDHPSMLKNFSSKRQPKTMKIKRKPSEHEISNSDENDQDASSSSDSESEVVRLAEEVKQKTTDLSKRFRYSDIYKLSLPKVQYVPITQVKRQPNQLSDVEVKMRMNHLQESAGRVEALLPKWSSVVTALRDNDDVGELRKTLANASVILNSKVHSVKKMMKRSLANTGNTAEEKENVEYYSRLVQLDIDSLERQFMLHEKNLNEKLDNPSRND